MKQNDRIEALEQEMEALRRTVDELAFLNSLAEQIGALQSSAAIIEAIVYRTVRRCNAEQGVIALVEHETTDPMKTLVRSMNRSIPQAQYHVQQSLLGWMLKYREPLRIDSPAQDERFRGSPWDSDIRSLLAVPLLVKGALTGMLVLFNKKNGGFTVEDQRMLSIVGTQSAQVIENARLYEEEVTLSALEGEMRAAADIQRGLLPAESPMLPQYDIAGVYVPSRLIGGDYFDYIPLADGRWVVAIGDVSGKGIAAALFMSVCRTLLRACVHEADGPADALHRLNEALGKDEHGALFITLLVGILDPTAGTFKYASGGHDSPLLLRASGGAELLPKPNGMLLGVFPVSDWSEHTVHLAPGDALVCYTDGVTEAMAPGGAMFGLEGMMALFDRRPLADAADTLRELTHAVDAYSDPTSQRDDLTVVVLKRL